MISDDLNYSVRIKLKTANILDIDARLSEIRALHEYLNELTEWQPYMYDIKYLFAHSGVEVWFKEEQHAMMFALRWS